MGFPLTSGDVHTFGAATIMRAPLVRRFNPLFPFVSASPPSTYWLTMGTETLTVVVRHIQASRYVSGEHPIYIKLWMFPPLPALSSGFTVAADWLYVSQLA